MCCESNLCKQISGHKNVESVGKRQILEVEAFWLPLMFEWALFREPVFFS